MKSAPLLWFVYLRTLVFLCALGLMASCGSDAPGGGAERCTSPDDCASGVCAPNGRCAASDGDAVDGDASDTDVQDPDTSDVPDDGREPGTGALCDICEADGDCLDGHVCAALQFARYCVSPCSASAPCPDGYRCNPVTGHDGNFCAPTDQICGDCEDLDGDGFAVGRDCGPVDCDDTDPEVYPGAPERCDGRDTSCSGAVDDGFDLNTDVDHCGACGTSCRASGVAARCVGGECQAEACAEGFVDCDGVPGNGCETPVAELNACGGCARDVDADEGAPCGTCDTGRWVCTASDTLVCEGDAGLDVLNSCGGCTPLEDRLGAPCGHCNLGSIRCDGEEATRCVEPDTEGWNVCGASCCSPGTACAFDMCVTERACESDNDCINDTYCEVGLGLCVPYGTGPRGDFNDSCSRLVAVARFSPQLQCVWDTPPADDPYPAWSHVLSTPMVADFNFNQNTSVPRPSIVFVTDDGVDGSSELNTGLVRIIDGRTCELQYTLSMTFTSHSSPVAIGDLDGDGIPEIVAYGGLGGLVAFEYVVDEDRWQVRWESRNADGSPYLVRNAAWGGPGIHDLDDDGVPEILRGGIVLSNEGVVLNDALGVLAYASASANHSAAFDVDGNGRAELITGNGVWEWNPEETRWDPAPYFVGSAATTLGFVAIADFGDYPVPGLDIPNLPEVVVVRDGAVRVQTLGGQVIFGPVAIPGGGTGGPPTVGDFDGDGRPEIAAAGRGSLTVFDLDCTPDGAGGTCSSGRTDGILWSRGSQDFSSSQTGSSIFDFEGDGRAEAIYADECFVRVYDGITGDVIFSQYHKSCTWQENPIVADVDGDFNSELVVPSNTNCSVVCQGLDPGGLDPYFPGLRCEVNEDCLSGQCNEGLCRCTEDVECCGDACDVFGFVCAGPPAGTPGVGNTCRARHIDGARGIRVYSDLLDRWVNSRMIWNQHAYNVTNVEESGRIPRTSDVRPNWTVEGLNNFRQNVQGDLNPLAAPDLTSRPNTSGLVCTDDGELTIVADVCNRGVESVPADTAVAFYAGHPSEGARVCTTMLEATLVSGSCAVVTCSWANPPETAPGVDVWVVPNPDGSMGECADDNNAAIIPDVYCGGV